MIWHQKSVLLVHVPFKCQRDGGNCKNGRLEVQASWLAGLVCGRIDYARWVLTVEQRLEASHLCCNARFIERKWSSAALCSH